MSTRLATTTGRMNAARYTAGKGVVFCPLEVPEISEDEILLHVKATSICGTDMKIVRNGHSKLRPNQTITLGHEFVGIIEKVGSMISGYQVGMRVGIAPNIGCGLCRMCIQGMPNMCPEYSAFGINLNGSHTDYVVIPYSAICQGNVIPLPDNISWSHAALAEPLSCVLNGIRSCQIQFGDKVVIYGAGPIGILHLLTARVSGAAQIFMIDINHGRLEQAQNMGADEVINSADQNVRNKIQDLTDMEGVNVVITACSIPSVQEEGLTLLAPFGRLCLFGGLPHDRPMIQLNSNLIHYKNLVVTGVTGGPPKDYHAALNLMAGGKVDVSGVISDVVPDSDFETAYQIAMAGHGLKVVVETKEQ